jgi:hypothetical protein
LPALRAAPASATVALVALVLAACGGGDSPPRPDGTAPAGDGEATAAATPRTHPLCTRLRVRTLGRVAAEAGTELSGLARTRDGALWTHNDSGGTPQVFELGEDGALRRAVTLQGAQNIDWEDIAARNRTLYVGDIGDNAEVRPEVTVYRFTEPADGVTTVTPDRLTFRYPDGAHDAEALLVDPHGGRVSIVTKSLTGDSALYVDAGGGALRKAGELSLGLGQSVTAGDVSGDGRTVVLRTYDRAFVYARRGGEPLSRALARDPCTAGAELLDEGQGEALALTRDGGAFLTVAEGARSPLRRYEP